jgi:hypothetical protein
MVQSLVYSRKLAKTVSVQSVRDITLDSDSGTEKRDLVFLGLRSGGLRVNRPAGNVGYSLLSLRPEAVPFTPHGSFCSLPQSVVSASFDMSVEYRSQMISFRLTEEEHERFRQLCFTHGIRSVSELARAAMNTYLEEASRVTQSALESRVVELENRLHLLALEVKRLSHRQTPYSFPVRK